VSDEGSGSERTEQPTQKRRDEARREGRYPASRDVPGALVLLGGLGVLAMGGGHIVTTAVHELARGLATLPTGELTVDAVMARFVDAGTLFLRLGWPFLVVPMVIAVAAGLAQSRLTLPLAAVKPKWERIDPWQGLGRLLSLRGAVDVVRAILKLLVVGAVTYVTVRADWPLLATMSTDSGAAASAIAQVLWHLWLRIGFAFVVLAALDYGYQWWQHEKSLRMTRQEVRQEGKEQEGSPLMRQRLRSLHRQMATRRMMSEVRTADVVLRNPIHYAVALKYDAARMRAPRVVAKGERLVAQRIVDEAVRHGVPTVENPPLARALFKAVALGKEIPADLYRAVAEVLAYVYGLRGGRR
jgi:flagellar biosynthetic protein FlhB